MANSETRHVQNHGPYVVCLVGGFTVQVDEMPIAVPACCERLIAYLAIAEMPIERVRLAGTLWMEKSDNRATANLRTALWRLRKVCAPLVVDRGSRVALGTGVEVDIHHQERWADRLRAQKPTAEDLDVKVRSLNIGLLADWYDDWVLLERERHRQRTLHAIEALIAQLVTHGRFEEALDAGYGALAMEPLREGTHRAVIQAHLAEGNRSEAIRHITMCRDLYRAELQVDILATFEPLLRSAGT